MVKYQFSEEEINRLIKYKELLESFDKESQKLGISLLVDECKEKLIPLYDSFGCYDIIILLENRSSFYYMCVLQGLIEHKVYYVKT